MLEAIRPRGIGDTLNGILFHHPRLSIREAGVTIRHRGAAKVDALENLQASSVADHLDRVSNRLEKRHRVELIRGAEETLSYRTHQMYLKAERFAYEHDRPVHDKVKASAQRTIDAVATAYSIDQRYDRGDSSGVHFLYAGFLQSSDASVRRQAIDRLGDMDFSTVSDIFQAWTYQVRGLMQGGSPLTGNMRNDLHGRGQFHVDDLTAMVSQARRSYETTQRSAFTTLIVSTAQYPPEYLSKLSTSQLEQTVVRLFDQNIITDDSRSRSVGGIVHARMQFAEGLGSALHDFRNFYGEDIHVAGEEFIQLYQAVQDSNFQHALLSERAFIQKEFPEVRLQSEL